MRTFTKSPTDDLPLARCQKEANWLWATSCHVLLYPANKTHKDALYFVSDFIFLIFKATVFNRAFWCKEPWPHQHRRGHQHRQHHGECWRQHPSSMTWNPQTWWLEYHSPRMICSGHLEVMIRTNSKYTLVGAQMTNFSIRRLSSPFN